MSAAELEAANFAAAQGRSLERQAEIFGQWSNRLDAILERERKQREKQEMKQEIRKNAEQEKQEEEKQEKQQKESQKRNKEKNGMKRKRASPSTSRSVVRDAKPFKCSECGKGFTLNTCLSRHYKYQHTSQGLMCHFCPKRFRTHEPSRLVSHEVYCKSNPKNQ